MRRFILVLFFLFSWALSATDFRSDSSDSSEDKGNPTLSTWQTRQCPHCKRYYLRDDVLQLEAKCLTTDRLYPSRTKGKLITLKNKVLSLKDTIDNQKQTIQSLQSEIDTLKKKHENDINILRALFGKNSRVQGRINSFYEGPKQ